ncbi:hypothetical protein EJF18_50517 [Clavispora lusitaniae]|uniref:Uncharacterized protein n=1 Tax=Clavispora lusitaniae TaxID=36911 RepID=A0ACD0WPS2_CLALS|nr:hypothetical protein EJF14_50517 [Clavispora lusitaniae]QFZ34948.1 hypothetical protein EJF16_50517 [Clavispora lusitaniae]QFZ40633.1 hypothetical protein EJF15_50517 [Clavispora lusitaniae]QFZ46313.1 hypothetical protein EJF18_50517 [Clavispora lusitaniae]QFZ51975.1 hypothetical protein EJF17_50517 [Clavispora lusitaniae]
MLAWCMGLYSCLLLAMVMGHSLGLQTGKKRHDKSWTTIIETGNLGSVANSGCVDCEPKAPKQAKDGKKRKKIPSHISKHNKSNSAEQLVEFFNARYFTLSSAPIDIFKRYCVQCPCIRFRSLVNIFINTRKKVEHLIILLFPPNIRAAHLSVC